MTDDQQMTPPTPQAVVRADAASRAMRAWNMRVSGATWQDIADTLGYSDPSNALRATRNYLGELPQVQREDLQRLWRARHEELWRLAHRDALDGRNGALRAGVAVARSASQLDGLDAPTRVEVSPDAATFEAVVQRLAAAHRGTDDAIEADVVEMPSEEGFELDEDPAAER